MNINKRLFITTLIIISFVIIFTSVLMPPSRANAKNTQSREEIIINELLARDSEIIKKEPAAFVEKLNKIGASVFSFYRGTAALFYRDMFEPAMNLSSGDKGFTMPEFEKCHINGDLHIANFGFSIDSEGRIQFDELFRYDGPVADLLVYHGDHNGQCAGRRHGPPRRYQTLERGA